ncbi:Bax inhibitor family protein [Conidiobolus coronatus NRRL 28638]|uniref:Bax inhibitor family protein n=1 Tax=Conidiobolus coronatus (strain ATCC 28846 / CBS 209.66 / NRRL 28638) TaxID=796925 RepID=A0A137NQI1_CONC2|nr:Bax inhibitor family protein [Conidiobolus coronatus NRRL 28638]|eukprot:KXN65019.1 Bax inhibitor family protein [Conidiobolus coronatus NRRL 28638]
MSNSNYQSIPTNNPPPSYSESAPIKKNSPTSDYTHGPSYGASGSGYNNYSDVPEDFQFGVTVGQSDVSIRNAFIKKVYFILLCQLGLTSLTAGLFSFNNTLNTFLFQNQWIPIVSSILAFVNMLVLIWKRQSYPTNFILLGTFTFLEGLSLGTLISFYEVTIIIQALVLTVGIFVSLTLFAMQTKYDFSSWQSYLITGLWVLILVGFIQLFIPFNSVLELIISVVTALIFSALIVVDTQNILLRVSPDEYIIASVELYLDFINLFIAILRILEAIYGSNND